LRFWDASAVVPLLLLEARTAEMLALAGDGPGVVTWWTTRIECVSAIRRREREGVPPAAVRQALEFLDSLASAWSEVAPAEAVRISAERLLAVHPARAGDALQLAAALTWRGQTTERRELVSLDERLRDAASREGFALVPAEL
jgi:hypothetical protein